MQKRKRKQNVLFTMVQFACDSPLYIWSLLDEHWTFKHGNEMQTENRHRLNEIGIILTLTKPKIMQEMNVNAVGCVRSCELWVRANVAYCKCLFRWYEYQSCCHMTACHSDRTDKKLHFYRCQNDGTHFGINNFNM